MSSPAGRPKQTSRWGSLLSGAVAGLESRLDTFFEEGDGPNGVKKAATSQNTTTTSKDVGSYLSSSVAPSLLEKQDGLASSSGSQDNTTARLSSDLMTIRPGEDASDVVPRLSLDSKTNQPTQPAAFVAANLPSYASNNEEPSSGNKEETGDSMGLTAAGVFVTTSEKIHTPISSSRPSLDLADTSEGQESDSIPHRSSQAPSLDDASAKEYQSRIMQLQADNETAELARQEEIHSYLERIDALQAKLQYLAGEAAETARQGAGDISADAMQRKLAAKDEQIALLMEEGQKLSKAEVTQAGNARKLRIRITEDGRALAEAKRRAAAGEKLVDDLSGKIRRLETNQRDALAKSSRIPQLEKELSAVKVSRDEHASTVKVLRGQLESESKKSQATEMKANNAALDQQRKATQSLQDDLANAKIERQLAEDRLRGEIRAAKEELEGEKERNLGAEFQMRNEITALETRIESMRARNEEASSATTGDSRAKLMRQIELLQSQYALAHENWQGIESSLQVRLTAAEKERNDTAKAETEARKRARESSNTVRRLQEQVEVTTRNCSILEQELRERQDHAEKLDARVKEFERSIKEANSNVEQERSSWELKLTQRIEEEKAKWRMELSSYASEPSLPPDSPALLRKHSNYDIPSISNRRSVARHFSSAELSLPITSDRRRSSYNKRHDAISPNGIESGRSTPGLNGKMPHTPSIHTVEADDDNFDNDSSPHRTVNDMISVSTAGAGPSVQLVERMSAAVRRLESEKAATKDELTRLVDQRDEARKEVVALMAEIEDKRSLEGKVRKLEQNMLAVEQRYQTTLEMLGEKSERVDELEHDIMDLKKIYRELVETMR